MGLSRQKTCPATFSMKHCREDKVSPAVGNFPSRCSFSSPNVACGHNHRRLGLRPDPVGTPFKPSQGPVPTRSGRSPNLRRGVCRVGRDGVPTYEDARSYLRL